MCGIYLTSAAGQSEKSCVLLLMKNDAKADKWFLVLHDPGKLDSAMRDVDNLHV